MRQTALCAIALLVFGVAGYADGPKFEVASVKLVEPGAFHGVSTSGGPGTEDPGRYHVSGINMSSLLAKAFDVQTDQFSGPAWLRDFTSANYYIIDATMPPGTTKEQFQRMLQNLLIERFHLVFHIEKRNFPGYALVVDKDGPKFKEVTQAGEAGPDLTVNPRAYLDAPRGTDDFPDLPGPRSFSMSRGGMTRAKYQERTMAEFVSNLGFIIGASQGKSVLEGYPQPRVVDKTGLTGKYTFILEYRDAGMAQIARRVSVASVGAGSEALARLAESDDAGGGPSIISAIQKQLGLRLDKTTDVPLDLVVVDSVDKVPTEN